MFVNVVHDSTPPVEGVRARQRARRLEDIHDAAMEIIRAEGLEALTTHRLAERLGIAVGALYRYHASKSALLAELERRALGVLRAMLTQALSEAEGALRGKYAPLARLALAARVYDRFSREKTTEFALVGQLVADPRLRVPAEEASGVIAVTLELLAVVAALFDAAAADGLLTAGDARERAVLYWSALRGVLELAKLKGHLPSFDAHALAEAMTRTMLLGFGAAPEAVTRAVASARRHDERHEHNDTENER